MLPGVIWLLCLSLLLLGLLMALLLTMLTMLRRRMLWIRTFRSYPQLVLH
jgi:hypothetical protein